MLNFSLKREEAHPQICEGIRKFERRKRLERRAKNQNGFCGRRPSVPTTRDGAAAARVAHNHEVPGSSPGPATNKSDPFLWVFFVVMGLGWVLGLRFSERKYDSPGCVHDEYAQELASSI